MTEMLESRGQGSTFLELASDALAGSSLFLPSPVAQRAIADYLDRETARIDALIEKKQRMIELWEERRDSLISELVTTPSLLAGRPTDPGSPSSKWVPLKHFCQLSSEYGLNVTSDDYRTEGVRLIRTSDIAEAGSLTDEGNAVFVDPGLAGRLLLESGDLLFSRSGTLGRCLFYTGHPCTSTFAAYLVRFRVRPEVDPRFVFYCARSRFFQEAIQADAIQSTISNFNAEKYGNVRLPWWEVRIQRAIADYLDRETARIDVLIEKIDQQVSLLAEHRQALITAAVTGELEIPGVVPC